MTVLVIGASGLVGAAAAAELGRHYRVVGASRAGEQRVDLDDPASITALFERLGPLEAVVSAAGVVPFAPATELNREDFLAGLGNKFLGQVELVRRGLAHVVDGGSFTLISGILSAETIPGSAAAAASNAAVDAYVRAAAPELPRGIRLNAVSPTVLTEATGYHEAFSGFETVDAAVVGRAYLRSVAGNATGRVFTVGY